MSSEQKNNVLGMSPEQYLKNTYLVLIGSGVLGIFGAILSTLIATTLLSSIAGLLGLAGLVLVVLGLFAFKETFNALQSSHLKYIGVLFLVFFVAGIVFGKILASIPMLLMIVSIMLNLVSLLCIYAGFKLNKKGKEASKDNVIEQLKSITY